MKHLFNHLVTPGSYLFLLGTLTLLLIIPAGCNRSINHSPDEVAARVNNKVLLRKDLPDLMPAGYSRADSERIAQNYINSWVKNKLISRKALENLSSSEIQEIERRLENTREALLIYKYEREMIRQRLDTVITEEEVQKYYEAHKSNFSLKKDIVKALYIKVPKTAPNIDQVRKWYRSDDHAELTSLESYCYQFANKFDDFNEQWVYFDIVLSKLPIKVKNENRFLRQNSFIEASDSSFYYFVSLRDHRFKSTAAPAEFVTRQIKSVIQNQRKIQFIKDLESNLYNDALNRNEFVIY